MTGLDNWLKRATRCLSKDSAAVVRTEIQEHYESAREATVKGGATAEEADRLALNALGDAKTANLQYRRVLLTSAEARLLRDTRSEARAICSRPWAKRLLLSMPIAALLAGSIFFITGASAIAAPLLLAGIGMAVLVGGPFLPIYTPHRARVFRFMKWAVLVGLFAMALGSAGLKRSWLLTPCIWPIAWIEWTRISIRRKLPIEQWPKALYF